MAEINWGLIQGNPIEQQAKAYSYADQIGQNAAKYQSGQQYAAGDYAGASRTQAQAGNIDQAQAIQQQGTKSAEAVHSYITQALPVFQKIMQTHAGDPDGGKQAIGQAFDSLAPEISQLTGHNDQAIAQLRQNLVNDPAGTLQRIQAMVPVKYSDVAPGATMVRQQGNEAPVPVFTAAPKAPEGFTGDPQTGYKFVPGGPADPQLRKQYKQDARDIIIQNPTAAQTGPAIDDKTTDYLAHRYLAGDTSVLTGLGRNGSHKLAIIKRAQEITDGLGGTPEGDAAAANLRTANAAALKQNTTMGAQVAQAEITASKNADLVLQLAPAGVGPTKTPIVDAWLQAGRKGSGNVDVAKFDTAMKTFATEYSRVMSGGSGSQALSDSSRHEVDELLNKSQTLDQIRGNISVMKKDMANRRAGIAEEHDSILRQLGGAPASNAPAAPDKAALKAKYGLD